MKTYKLDEGGYVVKDGAWVTGIYDSPKAARLACKVDPQALHDAWEAKRGPDGVVPLGVFLTLDEVQALTMAAP